jgi:hypothetical protein
MDPTDGTAGEVKAVADNPRGAVENQQEVRDVRKKQREIDEAEAVARNPEAAAENAAEVKLREAQRDATTSASADVQVGTDGSASTSTTAKKPGDKP